MRGDHKDSERTDRHSSRVASAASPVQKSPNTPTPAAQPVQNSPNTPKKAHFSQFCSSRENFVPHQAPNPVQNSPNTPTPAAQPVQNSPCSAGPGAHPVQNSPNTPTPAAQPVQNSPNTPKNAHFSQFCPSRENFVPLSPSRCPAGRTLYRAQRQTRYKTLPAQPVRRPNRYKTLPTRPKRPISASFAPAGRTLYRIHPHDPQQGELCTALTITMPSRENFVPHPAPPPVQNSPSTPVLQRFREKVRPAQLKTAFSPLSRLQGELFRAQASNKPRRANYFAHWG